MTIVPSTRLIPYPRVIVREIVVFLFDPSFLKACGEQAYLKLTATPLTSVIDVYDSQRFRHASAPWEKIRL